MRDKDFRTLCEAESLQYRSYINAPHKDKEWFQYFCSTINGYLFFDVFMSNYAKGLGTRQNDLVFDFGVGNKKPMGFESVKKKLQEGVDKKIIMRYLDEGDARTKVYQINNDIKQEIFEYLTYIQKTRMNNILDSFEDVYSLGVIKSYYKMFSDRYDKNTADQIIKTLTSAAPVEDIFADKGLNQRIKDAGKKFQVKNSK
tara:strand:- start:1687 stop:2286 length:600 start_codon:yes stop_codon:yes gene_type:complete